MKLKVAVALVLGLLLYLLAWPTPVDPQAWTPPPITPLSGDLTPNQALAAVTRFDLPDGHGPEDVAVDAAGRIYGGLQDGRVVRYNPSDQRWDTFFAGKGRPLGLHFDASGNLIVADAYLGLLSIDPSGEVTTLSTECEGLPFAFTDDLDIASDGIIYFSDASHKFTQAEWKADALEHRPNGRLLAYNPADRSTRVLMRDLYFANGIAVGADDAFVLVNETWKYRVLRYWLKGPKAGTHDIFIEHLPGYPDGISHGESGTFWLALPSIRNPQLEGLAGKPFLRKVVSRLPKGFQPRVERYAFLLGLDAEGRIVVNLQDPSGSVFAMITSVEEHAGTLYLGSLHEAAFATIGLP